MIEAFHISWSFYKENDSEFIITVFIKSFVYIRTESLTILLRVFGQQTL